VVGVRVNTIMNRFLPCNVQRILLFLSGMLTGWILLIVWLETHGVDIHNREDKWTVYIQEERYYPEDATRLHHILHEIFWHRNEPNEQ
jgi:hypothetical protein